jgi:hypothetical protein
MVSFGNQQLAPSTESSFFAAIRRLVLQGGLARSFPSFRREDSATGARRQYLDGRFPRQPGELKKAPLRRDVRPLGALPSEVLRDKMSHAPFRSCLDG